MSAIAITRRTMRRAAVAVGAVVAALAAAVPAQAAFGPVPDSFSVALTDRAGRPATQAGSHPNLRVGFDLNTVRDEFGNIVPDESMRDVSVELPPGIVGDPEAVPRCHVRDFHQYACSRFSMIGVATFHYNMLPSPGPTSTDRSAIYNLVPPKGVVARMGFQVVTVSVIMDVHLRSDGGYNIVTDIGNLAQQMQVHGTELELFGVPADLNGPGPFPIMDAHGTYGGPSGAPRAPYLTAPFECDAAPLTTTLRMRSWQNPGRWTHDTSTLTHGFTGCDALAFAPSLEVRPDLSVANAPSGLEARLAVPQNLEPDSLGTPHLRDVELTMPAGVAISPASADGLQGCTDAQAGLGAMTEPSCPNASKLGTVAIDTPALPEQLTGSVYLGAPKSMDASTGEMVRLLLIASGQGVTVKLEGRVTPDPVTGQMRVVFRDNPRLPFSLLTLRLKGGPRASVTTPQACGTYTSSARLTSWSGASVTAPSSFAITSKSDGSPCGPAGFAPSFSAGMVDPTGGAASTFSLTFGRGDQDQHLRDVTVQMPPGLTGVLASVVECADAAAAVGACGEGSRIGSVVTASGAGANPLYLPGRVHMTGPYKGAPLGLSIVVPAVAGPFDLGTVAVRAALFVDKHDASLRVVADPMPSILQGIPLQIRTVNVAIDKPGFMLNPTNCRPRSIVGRITSVLGTPADRSSRFQAANCASLRFAPRMGLRIGARGRTKPLITVPLRAAVRMPRGHANLASVRVNLPRNINARLPVINDNACDLADYEAGRCGSERAIGRATAITPLLRDPLAGDVYFVRNPARRLPDMVMALRGKLDVDVVGRVRVPRDLTLATTFDTIPDVPISMFVLQLRAGRRGPIGTIGNLCRASVRRGMKARLVFKGQNGKRIARRQRMRIAGCAKTIKDRRAGRAKGRGRSGRAKPRPGARRPARR